MTQLGYNYRIPDLLCALGSNQLKRLPQWIKRRQEIAKRYDDAFAELNEYFEPLEQKYESAYHIYVIKLKLENLKASRDEIFKALKAEGLGVNVHYMPIHLHPYYKNNSGTEEGLCPVAESIYKKIITLSIFPTMIEGDIEDVIEIVRKVVNYFF
jgi:perosamine synthetase